MTYTAPEINPYDPNSQDLAPETIPLDEVIKRAIQAAMLGLRVWMPAQVTAVHGNQKVDIQLLLKARYTDGTVIDIPPIQNVMVSMPMGSGWSIKMPLGVGDTGLALFCDRSLDIWSESDGGSVDPQDTRAHDISDPIFIPGLVPFENQTADSTTDLVITNGSAQAAFQKAGTFKFTNGSTELLQNLTNLVQTLSTASTIVGGPFTADVVNTLTQIAQNLKKLQGS